ncbi:MAG: sigma-54 dependent transcriptional regulator [Alphaproteobacteria bacterium]|uniref:Sigma-54 dependent transcriptional regulator n=1 Tax=Candidatus Nitrobium versatile TaxID=2884831 RepID=A0A953LZ96_9BACT|nr:sigma-54 dependent transcriptional regulator [Candidatus Nitrobium versatile]
MRFKILIAEDEEITLKHLVYTLKKEGYEVVGVRNGREALDQVEGDHFDVLITDIKMPEMSGIELLEKVKEKHPEIEVLIITGYGSIGSAVEAIKKGAYEYITKPFDLDELIIKVKNIHERKLLRKENVALKAYFGMNRKVSLIARSGSMLKILEVIEGIHNSDCNILLTGETGVGKSLLAKIIHFTSRRQNMPFLSINCATLTEELLASELFGHEKGAFTGAVRTKQGLVEIADTGTLFLDEIAEIATNLQAKLLKVIEEGEFYRVGGTRPIRVDVRFIAATNQQVKKLIAEGKFREDLYYRLNVMEIFISPLRDRREDIEPLSTYFLQKHLPKANKRITGFSKQAMDILLHYRFPGNVRELENIIERAVILEKSSLITPESLPQSLTLYQIETIEPDKIKTIDELNREYAEKVVEMVGGNKSKAAELLGISRTSLWRILKEDLIPDERS